MDYFAISDAGNENKKFYSKYGMHMATGYDRIVYGKRGAYIEFSRDNINLSSIYIPKSEEWRLNSSKAFYVECRSKCSGYVKVYYQLKTVSYADYKIGKFYISPYDLKDVTIEEYQANLVNNLFKE